MATSRTTFLLNKEWRRIESTEENKLLIFMKELKLENKS